MAASRKTYVEIAAALRKSLPPDSDDFARYSQWETDVHAVARALGADNPRFDRETFFRECVAGATGVGERTSYGYTRYIPNDHTL